MHPLTSFILFLIPFSLAGGSYYHAVRREVLPQGHKVEIPAANPPDAKIGSKKVAEITIDNKGGNGEDDKAKDDHETEGTEEKEVDGAKTLNETALEENNVETEGAHRFVPGATVESGAVKRGVMVFVGISAIFILYVGIQTYRGKNSRASVRKYGVRGKRGDMEMTPLPLDDDEDDETVFDLGNLRR